MKFKKTGQWALMSVLLWQALFQTSFAAVKVPEIIELEKGPYYSSDNLYAAALKLQKTYPEIIQVEVIGKSTDGNPMYAVRLGKDIKNQTKESLQLQNNILITAGLHARETANPVFVMKMIEDYARDYQNDSYLPSVNVKQSLEKTVYHFIPSCNPDGFDLVKFGVKSIGTPSVKEYYLNNVSAQDLSVYKANLRGVDLNRNFMSEYFDIHTKVWKDRFNSTKPSLISYRPSARYFSGEIGAETETKVLSQYFLSYDFRVYLSYHSQGNIVYSGAQYLGPIFDQHASNYGHIAMGITGYHNAVSSGTETVSAWGYESGYAGYMAYKPLVTVETLTSGTNPSAGKTYTKEYAGHKLYLVPVALANQTLKEQYADAKLYRNDVYFTDVYNPDYAKALAEKYQMTLVTYKGAPAYNLYKAAEEKLTFTTEAGVPLEAALQVLIVADGSKLVEFETVPKEIRDIYGLSSVFSPVVKSEKTYVDYAVMIEWLNAIGIQTK